MRWLRDGRTLTIDESRQDIEGFERSWLQKGFGLFALEEKVSAELIGFVGLSIPAFLPEILPAVEIGWRLARHAWGKGLATEGARAALEFGFGRSELERIVSIHQVGNDASGRIMEKLGMHLERETVHPTCNRPLRVYEIGRDDWRQTVGSTATR
jgi:RimJ/RimL family protein N-acetyltransferase